VGWVVKHQSTPVSPTASGLGALKTCLHLKTHPDRFHSPRGPSNCVHTNSKTRGSQTVSTPKNASRPISQPSRALKLCPHQFQGLGALKTCLHIKTCPDRFHSPRGPSNCVHTNSKASGLSNTHSTVSGWLGLKSANGKTSLTSAFLLAVLCSSSAGGPGPLTEANPSPLTEANPSPLAEATRGHSVQMEVHTRNPVTVCRAQHGGIRSSCHRVL
jgi:hypothetical protein